MFVTCVIFSLTLLFTLCAYFVDYAFVIVVIKESYFESYYYYIFELQNNANNFGFSFVRTLTTCHCPHSAAAAADRRPPAVQQSIDASRAHSSKPSSRTAKQSRIEDVVDRFSLLSDAVLGDCENNLFS